MVCREGVEPSTIRLKVECSTTELPARTKSDAAGVAAEHSHADCAGNGIARSSIIRCCARKGHGQAGDRQALEPRAERAGLGKLGKRARNNTFAVATGFLRHQRSQPEKERAQLH